MSGLLGRVGGFFLEPAQAPPGRVTAPPATPVPLRAVVLGTAADAVVALAAACAGELRAREAGDAALVCAWRLAPSLPAGSADAPTAESELWEAPVATVPSVDGGADPAPRRTPTGASTPGARRVTAILTEHGLAATACGRLAWLALAADPREAAREASCASAVTPWPMVLAVAGPRPAAFEPLLSDVDLGVAVLATDAEPTLRELARAATPGRVTALVGPPAPGPTRWAAMAGLGRLRSLPELRS